MAEPTKICPGCKQDLPHTDKYFAVDRCKSTGLTSRCRQCRAAASKKRYWKDPETARNQNGRAYARRRELAQGGSA